MSVVKKLIALILAGYGLWVVSLKLILVSKGGELQMTNFIIGFVLLVGGLYWFYKLVKPPVGQK